MAFVAIRDHWFANGPIDADIPVIPAKPAIIVRVESLTDLVMQVCVVRQHTESVCKSVRHVYLPDAFIAQCSAEPAPERGRVAPDIDYDIEDPATHHREYLRLRLSLRKVHSAQHVSGRTGVIVLDKILGDPDRAVP